jgi:hypothetical protein
MQGGELQNASSWVRDRIEYYPGEFQMTFPQRLHCIILFAIWYYVILNKCLTVVRFVLGYSPASVICDNISEHSGTDSVRNVGT